MSNLQIEVGKWYKTSCGYKAYITTKLPDHAAASRPFLAYIVSPDGIYCCQTEYDEHGYSKGSNTYNIKEEWKEPKSGVAYVNIFDDGIGGTFNTRREADGTSVKEDRIACIRIEWKEGQFDD